MRHLMVRWIHDLRDEPVELYSELDDAGYEIRKVEIYQDGRRDFADEAFSSGSTMLGEGPFPRLEEIAAQDEFSLSLIDAADFERVWREAVGDSRGACRRGSGTRGAGDLTSHFNADANLTLSRP